MKNENGFALILLLLIGILIAAGLYIFSLNKTADTNSKNTPTGENTSDTPSEKAKGAVDATRDAQDRLNKAGSIIENN